MLIAYASRTGTKTTIAALRKAKWRLLVSATGVQNNEGMQYALDNGAWTAHQQKRPFDTALFTKALHKLGANADWTVLPDIVAGGMKSLDMSLGWLRTVLSASPMALLAVQDGMEPGDVANVLGPRVGIFVGGSTEWKLSTMPVWGALARDVGCWCHVGRVNSRKRIKLCYEAGATSFDGTSVTKFAKTLVPLDAARREFA